MKLEHERCYLAVKSRDARFDGHFFTGVRTTGVYCRPVCPAKTPHAKNVRFYACAAAAEAAGFRPCLRCRPEASPGTPAWLGTSSTVSRALQLIYAGALDDEEVTVSDLAQQLGIGPRHLRRLFEQHLGASPVKVAQTRRVHFAKKLIEETALPISQIVFASGFSSIRRFNTSFRNAYQQPPSSFRKRKETGRAQKNPSLELKLSYRPPLDQKSLLDFLGTRAIPGVESVDDSGYRRTVRIGKISGVIQVRFSPNEQLVLNVPAQLSKGLIYIVERVRRCFDLNADPKSISDQLSKDPSLAEQVQKHPGLRVPGAWDGFEIAVRAILGQQVSVQAATTLSGRLVEAYGDPFPGVDQENLRYLFPQAETLVQANLERIGLIRSRANAIRALAHATSERRVVFSASSRLSSVVRTLTALPGIGPWTAHYVAMRAFSEPDAFPAEDLVLRRAAAQPAEEILSKSELLQRAEAWRPWRAYAAMHLWASYTQPSKRKVI